MLTGKGDDRLVWTLALCQVISDSVVVADGVLNIPCHHHGPGLPADLLKADDLLVEVVHHDLGLEADAMTVAVSPIRDRAGEHDTRMGSVIRVILAAVCLAQWPSTSSLSTIIVVTGNRRRELVVARSI